MSSARPIGLAPGAPAAAAGQDARKYQTTNPVVARLLGRWLDRLAAMVGDPQGTIVDLGTGEGWAAARMATSVPRRSLVAVEYRIDKLAVAHERIPHALPVVADAAMVPLRSGAAELVTCIEVLEHLPRVEPAVAELSRLTADRCVVSVPWEPWFRLGNLARGKNLRRLGNDPEHVGWFTPARLRAALAPWFEEVRVERAFPWLLAEARRPIQRVKAAVDDREPLVPAARP